jgi:adenosine deaminase
MGQATPAEAMKEMTSHLHLHLEPNERMRRRIGRVRRAYASSDELFSEHQPNNTERLNVDLSDLEYFINDLHEEQRAQSVDYAEIRLSPRRFCSFGFSLAEILTVADQTVSGLADPVVKLILLINRDSSPEFIEECEDAIAGRLPRNFVGVDLAGDETRFSAVGKFGRFFRKARETGLGVTVHAGEFGNLNNVWRAIDELGAERIGHGTSAGGCDAIATRLRADQIMIEVSVTSNVALGAVSSLESHPLPWFVENDIPVCLNTDVPLHLGTDMHMERQAARRILGNHELLDAMDLSARRKSFRSRGSAHHRRIDR